jgi:hypothetical protein
VVLLTNSPRPRRDVITQLEGLGVPRDAYDDLVSSGDAAQDAMAAGMVGRRVYHLGPERDLGFFTHEDGRPVDVERVPLEEAEGIVCTGLFDDRTETPQDYRATILYGVNKGLKLLCANPDVDRRRRREPDLLRRRDRRGLQRRRRREPLLRQAAPADLPDGAAAARGGARPGRRVGRHPLRSATASPPTSRARSARTSIRSS